MQTGHDRNIFLSTMPATSRDRAAALTVVAVSALLFACALPFAGVPLTPVPAFVASYQSALAINDLITAVLLFSQFAVSRSRRLQRWSGRISLLLLNRIGKTRDLFGHKLELNFSFHGGAVSLH